MRSSRSYRRSIAAVVGLLVGLLAPATMGFAQGNPNPGVLPPRATAYGMTYGEWSARWWQWGLGQPAATNPIDDPTGAFCDVGQSGPVWFLAGTFGGAA